MSTGITYDIDIPTPLLVLGGILALIFFVWLLIGIAFPDSDPGDGTS